MAQTNEVEQEREHILSADCWCHPTVEHVEAK